MLRGDDLVRKSMRDDGVPSAARLVHLQASFFLEDAVSKLLEHAGFKPAGNPHRAKAELYPVIAAIAVKGDLAPFAAESPDNGENAKARGSTPRRKPLERVAVKPLRRYQGAGVHTAQLMDKHPSARGPRSSALSTATGKMGSDAATGKPVISPENFTRDDMRAVVIFLQAEAEIAAGLRAAGIAKTASCGSITKRQNSRVGRVGPAYGYSGGQPLLGLIGENHRHFRREAGIF